MAELAEDQSQAPSKPIQIGSKPKLVEQEINIRSEKWFAEIVGLPNWGINPLRDLFHIKNTDLFDVFQRKVSHKGYELAQCKSLKVKSRMEEL